MIRSTFSITFNYTTNINDRFNETIYAQNKCHAFKRTNTVLTSPPTNVLFIIDLQLRSSWISSLFANNKHLPIQRTMATGQML